MKETEVRARISLKLKEQFHEKLDQDGISQSDFITACILNYLGVKTVPVPLTENKNKTKEGV
jgi:antitoxin component of RelBE/YafQ-DinJ toxin-antitoxin module